MLLYHGGLLNPVPIRLMISIYTIHIYSLFLTTYEWPFYSLVKGDRLEFPSLFSMSRIVQACPIFIMIISLFCEHTAHIVYPVLA